MLTSVFKEFMDFFFFFPISHAEKGRELRVKMLTRWWYNLSILCIGYKGWLLELPSPAF